MFITKRLSLLALCLICLFLTLASFTYLQAAPVLSVKGTGAATMPGQETAYHLQLLNHTDQILYNGVLSITLPAGFTYVPGSTQVAGHGWPMASEEPRIQGRTLAWGPYPLPAAGVQAHNPFGIHTLIYCDQPGPTLHLEGAKALVGSGGYVTQFFYAITTTTTGPSACAVNFVQEAYARNLIPIVRLGGVSVNGIWQAPDPGPNGDYAGIARAVARFVAGLPRRDTNPLYIQVWNEPDLWIEWSNRPNAREYGRFFVAVSQAIRRLGDARIRVVNGALTPGNRTFLEQLLQVPGFRDAFDTWASHCYPYNHPPGYNNHTGSARYGTYAIDCYLQELALIQRYGRGGVKVMVTETGYELGNKTFGFEGFPRIDETNRAAYIATAFAQYWQKWPEVVAVTPFELADTTGHWAEFDWLYPTPPYTRHLQYEAVAALPKPAGSIRPYGYQVSFRARVGNEVQPGVYSSRLKGSDGLGHTVSVASTARVRVYEAGALTSLYLPLLVKPFPQNGPWYLAAAPTPALGAIIPSHFLQPNPLQTSEISKSWTLSTTQRRLPLSGKPVVLALHEAAGLGIVGLSEGRLDIIDLAQWRSLKTIILGQEPGEIIPGPSGPARVYAAMGDGLALINLESGTIVRQVGGLGRLAGLAWDEPTRRLFAVDAANDRLLVFRDDLSGQLAELKFDHQPGQMLLDQAAHRLYISFPAVPQVIALDAGSLTVTGQGSLVGGPVLGLAFSPVDKRLYALSALTPRYRGLTTWQTPDLAPLSLVAGSANVPLQAASALARTPSGQIVLSERDGLWQVRPDDFVGHRISPAGALIPGGGLRVSESGGLYWIETAGYLHRIN